MAPLIKDGYATMEQGLDLARRGDLPRAQEKFGDASRKFSKDRNLLYANVASVYTSLLSPGVRNQYPPSLAGLIELLRSIPGSTPLKLGPRSISAEELGSETQLAAREVSLLSLVRSGTGDGETLSRSLQALAGDYRVLGSRVLFLPELLNHQAVTADSRFPFLMALSFESLGRSLERSDPMSSAEHFQTAHQYWTQAGNADAAQAAATRAGNLAQKARCWVCGREGSGHGVQFVSVAIDQDVSGLKDPDTSPLPPLDASGRYVFVCKGCHSAVLGLADRIAVQRASEVEGRLLHRIQSLEQRIQYLRQS